MAILWIRRALICLLVVWPLSLPLFARIPDIPSAEALHYEVRWLGVGVVDATFELEPVREAEGGLLYRLRVAAWTKAIPSRVYRVMNRYETLLDAETGSPTFYRTICDEALFRERLTAVYSQPERRATYDLEGSDREWAQALPGETHTVFSALYFVRFHDFGRISRVEFYVDAKGEYWRATAERVATRLDRDAPVWEIRVSFRRVGGSDRPRQSDLLTDNLVNPDAPLKLLLRPARRKGDLPLVTRMEYRAKGFRFTATLDGF